ncbi:MULTISPECIES: hypothetical protein [Micromonospora]|uniref:Uncharacterized protein n=1 Tax=Micromonospora carbonacea TaxID=47853 RepID=A0A7H8XPC8_9ACTN|nr:MULTISPECIES: hypothetical protein [Micromonospora]MBB5825023.1 hypothetical protein [Micromonospora carbonacea]QLD26866.1 hypothetical protein HXZ27_23795 [Micromonospora carbonacea]WFE57373.1 hypothetical protein O7633_11040 [Micromonospora sp. WMMD712]
MLVAVIVGCEIGFWVLLVAGLVARYPLRRPRLGAALLLCVPLVDLALLAAAALDLRRGATADVTHGLAAAYLGFSVAFGHSMIRWADQRFAHRFAGGPPPVRPPRHGWARARHEWREWAKALLGWAVACALLVAGIAFVGDAERTRALWDFARTLTVALLIWLVAFPVWETIFPSRPRR